MRIHSTICGTGLLTAAAVSAAKAGLPVDKVYGVNIGSWLLTEPWMLPNEWQRMGGEICDHCADCAASEFALTQKLGQEQADKVFAQHWATWFTQDHVNKFADGGLNSVRIALGFWIVEGLVDRKTEFYPRGGLPYLKKGLAMLKAKGIHAILDFHAMPGVSAANQMYAGRCTSDLQFYKDENYNRALIWGGVMTAISHMDPDFSTVFAIEAINNPVTDYSKTPGLGDYQRKFVKVVRLVELVFGITCTGADYSKIISNSTYDLHSAAEGGLLSLAPMIEPSLRPILQGIVDGIEYSAKQLGLPPAHVKRVVGSRPDADIDYPRLSDFPNVKDTASSQKRSIKDAAIGSKRAPHGFNSEKRTEEKRGYGAGAGANTQCLSTTFTTKYSQYNNPPNPADFAIGPQIYDAHLYYTFGQGADPNAESYLSSICNTNRVSKALADNNSPLIFGEFTLATNFADNSTFRRDWADAQKYVFASQADGWIFWNFRVEEGSVYSPAWSYLDSLAAGYFTKDPAKLNNPDICKPWMANGTSVA